MRGISAFLLFNFLVATMAPAWIVADFLVERGRIERELCVQRMVPDDQRSCHGECHLKKRLEKSGDPERELPFDLRALRIGEMILQEDASALVIPPDGHEPAWATLVEEPREGHPHPNAPVPWCWMA